MRKRQRACDEDDRAGDLDDALQARRGRQRAGEPAMHEVARDHGDERNEHEGRIGGTAVERHGGQHVVHQAEGRGMAPSA
jgi:hypothetical protein